VALLGTALASLAPPYSAVAAERASPNSADRMIFWSSCRELLGMTNADLDRWAERGVAAFSCNSQWLADLGGSQHFAGDLHALNGKQYGLEIALRGSRLAQRARHRGIDLYLGFYLANQRNARTPLVEWFDDQGWSEIVLPRVRSLAAAAHALGFAGISLDQELYPQADGRQTASWSWDYPGNTHSEQAVREEVRVRGAQLMRAMLEGFPNVAILAYASQFPDTWEEVVQAEVNGIQDAFGDAVHIDLWDGITSVDGYRSIRFLNAIFYKTTHIRDASWDDAFAYEFSNLFAMLSRRLSNWSRAADKIYESPFVWISSGSTNFEAARPPDEVRQQLAAARRWGMGRAFANYTSDNLETFDYGRYIAAMHAATHRGVVDQRPPRLAVTDVDRSDTDLVVAGTASDDFAVRVVRWRASDGRAGAIPMSWTGGSDPADGSRGWVRWEAKIPLVDSPGRIEITAEDIHGLTRTRSVTASS
jgi:hypothetical protein